MMARAATAPELARLRSDGQFSELFMAIHNPATVYTARINQSITSYDSVAELTYDGGSGTLGNVLPGMSLWIGSAPGARDKGVCRVRKTPTSTVLFINETSDIAFADNDYITVVDEFGLWPKHLRVSPVRMDYDIVYSDQHSLYDPVPVLGPIAAVLWLTGATVTFHPTAADSWVLGAATITGYSWSAPGASATSNMTTAAPTITYNAAGTYRISCTVTASNGKSYTGYRYVFVYSAAHPPVTAFTLENCAGDWEDGGWSFEVTMYDEADISSVRERALVTLFAKDYYAGVEGSIGPVTGYEHIIAVGWIDGESITWDPSGASVRLTVRGPHYWLKQMTGFPVGTKNTTGTPSDWTQFKNLTVDGGIWHMLHWRTTATAVLDVYRSGDTNLLPAAEGQIGSLWEQLSAIAEQSILAHPVCDRYGRLIVEVDSQYLPVTGRSFIPVVQAITTDDWRDQIEIERHTAPAVGTLELSGVSYNGTTATPLFSKAAGTVFKRYGRVETRDQLLLTDQTQANVLAGLILGRLNNEYPRVSVSLAQNNRLIDIAPRQYVTLTIAAEDTPRGVAFADKRFIPRRVELEYDNDSGSIQTRLDLEGETTNELAVTVIRPNTPIQNIPTLPEIIIPSWPIFPPPGIIIPPPVIPPEPPPEPGYDCVADPHAPANGPWNVFMSGEILNTNPTWKMAYFRAIARDSSYDYPTRYTVNGRWQKREIVGATPGAWYDVTDDDWWQIYLIDLNGNHLATGIHDTVTDPTSRTGHFNLGGPANFWGIEIILSPTLPTLHVDHVDASLFGHFWDAGDTHSVTYGIYGVENGLWVRATGHYDRAYWSWTGIRVTIYPVAPATFQDLWYQADGTMNVNSSQTIGGLRLYQNNDPNHPDIGTAELNAGSGSLHGYNNELKNIPYRTTIVLDAACWINAGSGPGQTYNGDVTWQVFPVASYRLVIDSAFLWNLCPWA
jgi:hypothetical protein